MLPDVHVGLLLQKDLLTSNLQATAAFIRFIAQVSLKAIRGEVAIYYGVPRA